ncbi:MAG: hypothetical protein WCX74_03960, partial [Candidatus Paceibacterota bacterium]
ELTTVVPVIITTGGLFVGVGVGVGVWVGVHVGTGVVGIGVGVTVTVGVGTGVGVNIFTVFIAEPTPPFFPSFTTTVILIVVADTEGLIKAISPFPKVAFSSIFPPATPQEYFKRSLSASLPVQ